MKRLVKKLFVLCLSLVMVLSTLSVAPAKAAGFDADEWWFPSVEYKVHRQTYGWEEDWVSNGETSGTMGESKRLEGICIKVNNKDYGYDLGIEYRTHIQSYGWEEEWKADGAMSGTEGESKRLEAIQIKLTGADREQFSVYYRVHAQNYGWLGWAKDGESAGTAGQSKRLEAIQIVILPAGNYPFGYDLEGSMGCAFIDVATKPSTDGAGMVSYMTHVQNYGDQKWVADGSIAGTSGESKRLEQIAIKVDNDKLDYREGSIEYKTHVQGIGWMDWVSDGDRSGTSGQSKRLEGIKIRLTGQLAAYYDVYYRVHAQTYGWLGWAKNGEPSGTEGYSKRLEAIQIAIVPKNSEMPNILPADADAKPFVSRTGTCSDEADLGITDTDHLYIYSHNDELRHKMGYFYEKYPEYSGMVTVINTDYYSDYERFGAELDELYQAGGEKVPSLVSVDMDGLHQLATSYDYYVPLTEVGITAEDYANAYDYTVDFATIDGELMGATWQSMPGVVVYRTDIAKEVLGSSDPKVVQEAISDWDKFMETADKMKAAGYYMVYSPDEVDYAFMAERTTPWQIDGALNIDNKVTDYMSFAKELADKGYAKNPEVSRWYMDWTEEMGNATEDEVFCYFGATWYVPWSFMTEGTETYGLHNVTVGPVNYNWGGNYIMATDACTNPELAELVIETLCCDEEVMYDMFAKEYEFPNNQKAVEMLIADGVGSLEKLDGQNPVPIYDAAAKGIEINDYAIAYDYIFAGYVNDATNRYLKGEDPTLEDAIFSLKTYIGAHFDEISTE